ncbi:MAG: hydantoinase B/oxoprolinase family protein [Alphaproteobacteria bacterium]|nr:hydantoinase B/oxoprolinase family protein [Alphaproteobacteria bacterium]
MDDLQRAATIDPITLEIIHHGLISIANQISANITRTAYSPLVYEYKDYACGLVDAEARLVAQADGSIPIFVANALGNAVSDGLLVYGADGLGHGDIVISNHGGTLGQHLNNVVMYTPVRIGANRERLVGFMCVLVHWIDVGGKLVGSCSPNDSTEIFQEGIQFRTVKVWSQGAPVREMYRMIEYNTRFPEMVLGDLEAQVAGTLQGRDLFLALLDRHGADTIERAIALIWDKSEAAARAAVRALPDGVYRARAFLDDDGVALGAPVAVEVAVMIAGDAMTVDLSGVADQLEGPLNSGLHGGAIPAARIAFKYLTTPEEPANEGSFRPLTVVIPEGKFLSATGNAPLALYSAPLPTVIDTILRAVAGADPTRVAAAHHGTFAAHTIFGRKPETGELYQQLDTGPGGWGASVAADGPGPFKSMAHGDTMDVPAEAQEAMFPLRILQMALRTDSAGAGRHRGGLGIEKLVEMLAPAGLSLTIERTGCPPWGLAGGEAASPGEGIIERAGEAPIRITKKNVNLAAGDRIRIRTAGGGGYGPAHERAPDAVAADVRAGYVGRDVARAIFAVALDETGAVDRAATEALRARAQSKPGGATKP